MSKYDKLDKAIMNKMGGHPQRFIKIFVRDVVVACEDIVTYEVLEGGEKRPAFRVADRRLQALRKQGLIQASSKGWIRTPARKEQ